MNVPKFVPRILPQIFPFMGKARQPLNQGPKFRAEPLVAVVSGEILDKYAVEQAAVYVVLDENDGGGKARYVVTEPTLDEEEQRVYSHIMEGLYFSLKPIAKTEDPLQYIEGYIWEVAENLGLVQQLEKAYQKYRYFIARDAIGYGPIDILMKDNDVEEISSEGYDKPVAVMHRRFTEYDWIDTNVRFASEDSLRTYVQRLAQKTGKSVTVAVPFADSMTSDGHRVAVTFAGEVTLPGSSFDIRKFPKDPLSIAHLIKSNTMSALMAAYYWLLVESKGFVMILGTMGSGKTTSLNSLSTMISPSSKIATIEDTPELRLPHTHWQRFKTRRTYSITESRFDVDLMDLVILSLRYRPDYVILGEVRGAEIRALIQAAAIGHSALCTMHAESPEAALVRMSSPPMDVSLGGRMLVWNFLMLNRVKDRQGKVIRRTISCTEVIPRENLMEMKQVFSWNPRTDRFAPDGDDSAEHLVETSYRLKEIAKLRGWTDDELVVQLEERQTLLADLVEESKLSYSDVSEAIQSYYRGNTRMT
jgi:flagellar protein FlaI